MMNSHDKRFYIPDAYAYNLNFDENLFRQINEKYVPLTIVYPKNYAVCYNTDADC